ncbi:MAG: hypothetical protein AB7G75_23695 [Candidatus Binatia bacterium]
MRVFISMPIVQHLDARRNFDAEARRFFERYFEALRENGVEPEAGVLMEDWGQEIPPRIEFTANDLRAIESAEAIVLITRTKLTRDMFLELGIALGLGQRGVIILPHDAWGTEMLLGLDELKRVSIIRFDVSTFDPIAVAAATVSQLRERPATCGT